MAPTLRSYFVEHNLLRDARAAGSRERRARLAARQAARDPISKELLPVDRAPDLEHTFECQMLAHALVYTEASSLRAVLREMDTTVVGKGLGTQPFVVQNRLKPLLPVQNSEANLDMLVTHATNTRKGNAVTRFLRDCDTGADARHDGLQAYLVPTFVRAHGEEDGHAAASRVLAALAGVRDTYEASIAALPDLPISEDVVCLFDAAL